MTGSAQKGHRGLASFAISAAGNARIQKAIPNPYQSQKLWPFFEAILAGIRAIRARMTITATQALPLPFI
jgi:hypothetical protein